MEQTRRVQRRPRVHITEHKGYAITVTYTGEVTSWDATARLRPPLKNGVRSFTIKGPRNSKTARLEVLQWARAYIDQNS